MPPWRYEDSGIRIWCRESIPPGTRHRSVSGMARSLFLAHFANGFNDLRWHEVHIPTPSGSGADNDNYAICSEGGSFALEPAAV